MGNSVWSQCFPVIKVEPGNGEKMPVIVAGFPADPFVKSRLGRDLFLHADKK